MPTNLYGPNDNYDEFSSHFYPALISKIHKAKVNKKKYLEIWGSGKAKRELMYVDDLANACEFFLKKKTKHFLINIGSGNEKTIIQYSKYIMKKLKTDLEIRLNMNKPAGTPRKILDTSLAKSYGWKSKIDMDQGFNLTYRDYLKKYFI
jgi:GDP-L-fucose synthase